MANSIMGKTAKNQKLAMKWIRTPKSIWNFLIKEFNFTVDACASDKNHLLSKYWTKKNSALDKNWDYEIVYCHPMYDINIPKLNDTDNSKKKSENIPQLNDNSIGPNRTRR